MAESSKPTAVRNAASGTWQQRTGQRDVFIEGAKVFDRDELAKEVMLTMLQSNYMGIADAPRMAYRIVDEMIAESKKAQKLFMRFKIGPVEKQPKDLALAPVGLDHKPHHPLGVSTMAFVLKDDEQVTATLEFFDKKGKKIASPKLDGVPAWSSTDPAKVSVTPAADGLSAVIVALGVPEDTATITATADADLGEGVKPVETTGDVQIIGGDVATSNMNFGAPTPQP